MKFTPKKKESTTHTSLRVELPYFDSDEGRKIPYAHSEMTIDESIAAIKKQMTLMCGYIESFREGDFEDEATGLTREGYIIEFNYQGVPGRIPVAALPVKKTTEKNRKRALVQALRNVYEWLRVAHTTPIFSPGSNFFLPYLLANVGTPQEISIRELIERQQGLVQQSQSPILVESVADER